MDLEHEEAEDVNYSIKKMELHGLTYQEHIIVIKTQPVDFLTQILFQLRFRLQMIGRIILIRQV